MKRFSLEIRIILTLALALVAVATIGALAYNALTGIVSDVRKEAQPDEKLLLLKDITNELTSAENSVKSYTITHENRYLSPYYSAAGQVDENLFYLDSIIKNDEQQKPLVDSINLLVEKKFAILNALINAQGGDRVNVALNKVSSTIRDNEKPKVKQPAAEEKEEKKGFFKKIFGKKKKPEVAEQTVDTAIKERLEKEINKIKEQEASLKRIYTATQLELTRKDQEITSEITALVTKMERQEREDILNKAERADMHSKEVNKLIAIFCIGVSLLLLLLGYGVVRYIRKSRAYSKALDEAKMMAENLARAKETFLANMSHEIRTPMNAIAGFTEQLLKSELHEEQAQQLTIIKRSTDHLLRIVNDVLDFSKINAGKMMVEHIPFHHEEVFEEIVLLMQQEAEKKNLLITYNSDKNIPSVLVGDPARIRQVLLNLVGNAIKFTQQGEISIRVGYEIVDRENILLKVTVSDTGIGIAPEKLEHIFDEFEQAESSTSRNYGGTGLGLSISKKLIELSGGEISLKSELNEGTQITFTLPCMVGDFGTINILHDQEAEPDTNNEQLIGKRLLIVDDAEYNRLLLKNILEKWQIIFDEATNGKEAFETVRDKDFDLVLMDVIMPVMSGFEATKSIRSLENIRRASVPVIALTAAVSADIQAQATEAGMSGLLQKPFKEQDLYKKIIEALGIQTKPPLFNPPPSTEKHNLFSLEELRRMAGGDEKFVEEMIQLFIKTTEEGIARVKTALLEKNFSAIAFHAHTMAAPCKHIEANTLCSLIKNTEAAAHEKSITDLQKIIPELEAEAHKLLDHLRLELEKISL